MKITSQETARLAIRDIVRNDQSVAAFTRSLCKAPTAAAALCHELSDMVETLRQAGVRITISGEGWEELSSLRGFSLKSWIAHLDVDEQRSLADGLSQVVDAYRRAFYWPDPRDKAESKAEPLQIAIVSTPDRVERHEVVRDGKGGIIGSLVQATDAVTVN